MAEVLNLRFPLTLCLSTRHEGLLHNWTSLQQKFKCNGKVSCFLSDKRREEQARKALESALDGKKDEFERWSREIKKLEEVGGGGVGGGGASGGGGGWFGSSGVDGFWPEAQQTGLAILGIVVMYLIVAKGELLLAVVFNPLLFSLRGIRNGFTLVTSQLPSAGGQADTGNAPNKEVHTPVSVKERVVRKWGSG